MWPGYLRTKWHLDPFSRLATTDMGRKLGGCAPWRLGPYLTNVARAEAYLHTKWHLDPFSRLATRDMDRKIGAAVPPFWGGG